MVGVVALALGGGSFLAGPLAPSGRDGGSVVLAAQEPTDPFFILMQALAFDQGKVLVVSADGLVTDEDLSGDVVGLNEGINDLTGGSYAWLPTVPSWLLDAVFGCSMADVACPKAGSDDAAFAGGAYLFYARLAGPPGSIGATKRGEWGPILALQQYPTAPIGPDSPFGGASHAVITRIDLGTKDVLYINNVDGTFQMFATDSRSRWRGNDLLTLVPKTKEVQTDPVGWDLYAFSSDGTEPGTGRDTIRGLDGVSLLAFDPAPTIEFQDAPGASSAPSGSPASASPGAGSSAAASVGSAAPSPGGVVTPASGPGAGLWPIAILIAIVVALIALWLLFGRRSRGGGSKPPPTPEPPPVPSTPPPAPTPAPPTPSTPAPPPPKLPSGPPGPADPAPPDPRPVPPPVPPPAPPIRCQDGEEQWREERPAQSFVVPPPDGKVRVTSAPTTTALEAWLFAFGFLRGAPFAAFVGLSDEDRDQLLEGLPTTPSEMHWAIEFQLDDYRLACQRKWVCEAGAWVPTDEFRLLESGPEPYYGRFAIGGPALSVDDVRRIWKDTRAVLVAAEAAVGSMKAYQAGCT